MKIAVIGWGSLIWNRRDLKIAEDWITGGGPTLPIEFSRVSKDCRLTLVIDHVNGVEVKTRYAISSFSNLHDAIENLRIREDAESSKPIGYINLRNGQNRAKGAAGAETIRAWARDAQVEAVIWSDFQPNFKEQTECEFSVDNGVRYLLNLPRRARENAFDYIRKAPEEVDTPLRRKLSEWRLI